MVLRIQTKVQQIFDLKTAACKGEALDCFLCAAKLRILLAPSLGNHGNPKGYNHALRACMFVRSTRLFLEEKPCLLNPVRILTSLAAHRTMVAHSTIKAQQIFNLNFYFVGFCLRVSLARRR